MWRRTDGGPLALEAVASVELVSAEGLVNPFTLRGADVSCSHVLLFMKPTASGVHCIEGDCVHPARCGAAAAGLPLQKILCFAGTGSDVRLCVIVCCTRYSSTAAAVLQAISWWTAWRPRRTTPQWAARRACTPLHRWAAGCGAVPPGCCGLCTAPAWPSRCPWPLAASSPRCIAFSSRAAACGSRRQQFLSC